MSHTIKSFIPSVNFHLWEPCNMSCKYCFATFKDVKQDVLPKGHLPKDEAIKVVKELANFGFKKITFAGGEPTLCKWLSELIFIAKENGMTTMIVTNGSYLNDSFLRHNKGLLDWIAISVDSLNQESNLRIGRAVSNNKCLSEIDYLTLANQIKQNGYGLKINTVVSRENYKEDMVNFIKLAKPQRWKILQVLPIKGQNDKEINHFTITEKEFEIFLNTHNDLQKITAIVPETNSLITGSYAMVDPAGRFFDNVNGEHSYSKSILEIGIEKALTEVKYSFQKFIARKGYYDWGFSHK